MESIFHALLRPEVMVFLIPITGIIGGIYYSVQKLKYKQGLNEADKQILAGVLRENNEIKQRLESLESIITSMDKELLEMKAYDDSKMTQLKVKELSDKMKSKE